MRVRPVAVALTLALASAGCAAPDESTQAWQHCDTDGRLWVTMEHDWRDTSDPERPWLRLQVTVDPSAGQPLADGPAASPATVHALRSCAGAASYGCSNLTPSPPLLLASQPVEIVSWAVKEGAFGGPRVAGSIGVRDGAGTVREARFAVAVRPAAACG